MADIYKSASGFRERIARGEARAFTEMTDAYAQALQRLRPELERLTRQIDRARARGEVVNTGWLYRQQRLTSFEAQIESEIKRFAVQAAEMTTNRQRSLTGEGTRDARALITIATGDGRNGRIEASAQGRMNAGALEAFVGFSGDGSPLRDLFNDLAPVAARRARARLIEGVALGFTTQRIGRDLAAVFDGNLARAMTIARTESLRSYREAQRVTYAENADVVEGWIWTCAQSSRTCAVCWAMNGVEFPTDERMGTHPNCRCVMVPKVEGGVRIERGEDLFRRLDKNTQRDILGTAKFEAWQAGAFPLSAIVGSRRDPRWGVVRFQRPLAEIMRDPTTQRAPVEKVKGAIPRAQTRPDEPEAAKTTRDKGQQAEGNRRAVSEALEVQNKNAEVANAIRQIDKVHTDGVLSRIPVTRSASKRTNGVYKYTLDGNAREISISSNGDHKALTMAHEIGHFIDQQAMNTAGTGKGKYLSASNDEIMRGWQEAVKNSRAVARFRELAQQTSVPHPTVEGKTYRPDRKYINYSLKPIELWARSYAQYIAVRSGDASMLRELNSERTGKMYPVQWDDDDFELIAQEIDKIFAAMGWAK